MLKVRGQIVDIPNRRIYKGEISVENTKIVSIDEVEHSEAHYIIPGFVDAHIHIESSMLTPSQFSTIAVKHGTVATVSDPHEIANVLGVEGVEYMIQDASTVPLKFNFGAPSCVPATSFETSGACIDSNDIESLLKRKEIRYLSEMMNYPGVIHGDKEVHKKLEIAKQLKKPIDGHAPGLVGEPLDKYLEAGISTDHECYSYDEALEKLQKGIKILIREGSAAKNFEALIDLMPEHYKDMMFCSDDKHPDDLMLHHINDLCKRAVENGVNVFKVLQAACLNPIEHYGLEVGKLRVGDAADFVVLEDLKAFKPLKTYIDGDLVFDKGKINFKTIESEHINNFECKKTIASDFRLSLKNRSINVIEAFDGELITGSFKANVCIEDGNACSNLEDDILKMVVVNRYPGGSSPKQIEGIAFVKNFGLKQGAIASSVAHDSHNIIAVGTSDNEISKAVNLIIENKGGICTVNKEFNKILKLPIAGLMSDKSPAEVAKKYSELDNLAKEFGSTLKAPFMTLSFMALLVIPSLKLSDKGLFDGDKFQFVSLEE